MTSDYQALETDRVRRGGTACQDLGRRTASLNGYPSRYCLMSGAEGMYTIDCKQYFATLTMTDDVLIQLVNNRGGRAGEFAHGARSVAEDSTVRARDSDNSRPSVAVTCQTTRSRRRVSQVLGQLTLSLSVRCERYTRRAIVYRSQILRPESCSNYKEQRNLQNAKFITGFY